MKRIVLLLIIALSTFHLYAQDEEHGERIKAIKTGYITNALNLTPQEAEKFWPIYNDYSEKINELRFNNMKQLLFKVKSEGGIDNLSDSEAEKIVKELMDIEMKMAVEKEKLYKNLIGVLPAKKRIKLYRAEQSFGRELLKQIRDKRRMGSDNRN
ncbi:MAG: sensor of ECF-type sigma factor [Flavobacteriaceae bacterium]|nr:sensor of ECF-type sigma factor [Flavobacteriaceae bacterium]